MHVRNQNQNTTKIKHSELTNAINSTARLPNTHNTHARATKNVRRSGIGAENDESRGGVDAREANARGCHRAQIRARGDASPARSVGRGRGRRGDDRVSNGVAVRRLLGGVELRHGARARDWRPAIAFVLVSNRTSPQFATAGDGERRGRRREGLRRNICEKERK